MDPLFFFLIYQGFDICFAQGALETFRKVQRCLPQRILMLRDGVSEGEFMAVKELEVAQLRGPRPVYRHFSAADCAWKRRLGKRMVRPTNGPC